MLNWCGVFGTPCISRSYTKIIKNKTSNNFHTFNNRIRFSYIAKTPCFITFCFCLIPALQTKQTRGSVIKTETRSGLKIPRPGNWPGRQNWKKHRPCVVLTAINADVYTTPPPQFVSITCSNWNIPGLMPPFGLANSRN